MELKDFVRDTISQVVAGVVEAQHATSASGAVVAPPVWARSKNPGSVHVFGKGGRVVQQIQFDVALTATSDTGAKAGIGVMLGTLALGTQGESNQGMSEQSRIQFSVPLIFPWAGAEEDADFTPVIDDVSVE